MLVVGSVGVVQQQKLMMWVRWLKKEHKLRKFTIHMVKKSSFHFMKNDDERIKGKTKI
jgi:hypothetical protein